MHGYDNPPRQCIVGIDDFEGHGVAIGAVPWVFKAVAGVVMFVCVLG